MEQIRRLIADGTLKPGDRLPNERDLGEQLGVGRSSVREAMRALTAMGLLLRRREGTFVNPDRSTLVWVALNRQGSLSSSTVQHVFEARRIFEAGIAMLAAQRATTEQVADIRSWVPGAVDDLESFKTADLHFHAAIASAAGNPFITELYSRVQEILFQTHQYYAALEELDPGSSANQFQQILLQHRAILEAIERHDPEAAQQAMLAHFRSLEKTMLPGEQGESGGARTD